MEVPVHPSRALPPQRSRQLEEAMAALTQRSSSAAHTAAAARLVEGALPAQRRTILRRNRADEARVAQLRGVFAAFDLDRDGALSRAELPPALLALGIQPTDAVVARYGSTVGVTLDTFVRATMDLSESTATSTEPDILQAMRIFDERGEGSLPLSVLLHLLCEVDTGADSALSMEEVRAVRHTPSSSQGAPDVGVIPVTAAQSQQFSTPCPLFVQAHELLLMTGVLTPAQIADPPTYAELAELEVPYEPFVRLLAFPLARDATGTVATGASTHPRKAER